MDSVNWPAESLEDHSNDTSAGDAWSASESSRWFWSPKILILSRTFSPVLSNTDSMSGSMRSI